MKYRLIISVFLLFIIFNACKQENKDNGLSTDVVDNTKTPVMTFDTTAHDFGTIQEGEIVSYTFEFTNTGDGPLLITDAVTSCGCTVPEYPKEPVQPGERSKIQVKFNSEGKEGLQKKTVTLVANTKPNQNKIQISSNVQPQIPQ